VYTGDIRLHGTKPQMTREFIAEAKAAKPIALICEGTRITDKPTDESEERVYREASAVVTNAKERLIFADFNFKDIDIVKTFHRLAKESSKKLVVKLKDCYYLKIVRLSSCLLALALIPIVVLMEEALKSVPVVYPSKK
jgi:ribonuclease J